MASTQRTTALEAWFRLNSGFLHPAIQIVEDDVSGLHYRAKASVEPGAALVSAPHSISLSYLNALVDDEFPVLGLQRHAFPVEAIGFFYLMAQRLNRNQSFWKPYLDTIPSPEDDLLQPVFFEDPEDIKWLEGTDVWHTVVARKKVYSKYYQGGIAILRQAGLDVSDYTWHLFLWAATIFTSRSFASRALHPEQSESCTTYKGTRDGQRQTVVVDMSLTAAEDLEFPVLFPGVDAANHSHSARVDWTFDRTTFSISINDSIQTGAEIFNNYGPKGNGELLIGYGFCIRDNPYDTVALTLKSPPAGLQRDLLRAQRDFFTPTGDWSVEKTTFRLSLPPASLSDASHVFSHLPQPLLELLVYILRYERKLPFELVSISPSNFATSRYLPHIARMIAQYLMHKLAQLQSVELPSEPANRKQMQAAIYRHSQVAILQTITSSLRTFMRSLIWTPSVQGRGLPMRPCLVRLEHLIGSLQSSNQLDAAFIEGIEASAGAKDLDILRAAGWEEDVWVLLLCYMHLDPTRYDEHIMSEIPTFRCHASEAVEVDEMGLEQAETTLEVVHTAASAFPDSLWADQRWGVQLIAAVGGEMFRHDSFNVMCVGADGKEQPRTLVYFHMVAD